MAPHQQHEKSTQPAVPLCEVCSKIPLDLLLSDEDRSPIGVSYPIGTGREIEERQFCALCRVCKEITDSLTHANVPWNDDPGGKCSFRIKPKAENKSAVEDLGNGLYGGDPEWYSLRVPMMVFIGPHAYLEVKLPYRPYIQNLVISRTSIIRQREPFLSDVQLRELMESAQRCKLNHVTCNASYETPGVVRPQASIPQLHLIDVRDRSIKPAQPDAQYITLSYRWAKGAKPAEAVHGVQAVGETCPGRLERLPNPMPPMLDDVIEVVRRLGQNFLWIDAYCINQKDPSEVQQTVNQMDDIYENSLLTICPFWADTDGGLPGISVPFKRHTFRFLSQDIFVYPLRYISDVDQEMHDSPWHSRGWIFQESLLSRQRLIFLPSSVVLLCQEQAVSPEFVTQKHSKTLRGFRTDLQLRANLGTSRTWDFDVYQKIIVAYSGRELSFQYDALNGITGILTRMSRQTGMVFQQALPKHQLEFLNALLWIPDIRFLSSVQQGGRINLRRRFEFASWSWLGFNIPIQYPLWLGPNPYSPQELALRVKYNVDLSRNFFMQNLEVETYDISLLEVAGFEFQGEGGGKPTSVTITTESASLAISLGRPKFFLHMQHKVYWSLTVAGYNKKVWEPSLTNHSSMSSFLIDSQILSQIPSRDGVLRLEFLMLAHISDVKSGETWGYRQAIGDTVLAMAVVRTHVPDVVERVAIVPVPYACWELAEPELVTLEII